MEFRKLAPSLLPLLAPVLVVGCVVPPGASDGGPGDGGPPPPGGPGAPVLQTVGDRLIPSDEAYAITVSATDPEPGPEAMQFSIIGTLPDGAKFEKERALFTWTPETSQLGLVAFVTFAVSDGEKEDRETVVMQVIEGGSTNHPPAIALIGDVTATPGSQLTLQLSATDPDGDPLLWRFIGPNPGGSQLDPTTGTFTFTPTGSDSGLVFPVSFEVDDTKDTSEATFRIFVSGAGAQNQPPAFAPLPAQSVAVGSSLQLDVNATDPDGDPLTYGVAAGLPAGASFDPGAARLSWTPSTAQAGFAVAVTFSVTDGVFNVLQTIDIFVGSGGGGGGACSADANEPNDTVSGATSVGTGTHSGLSICDVGDEDVLSFNAGAGEEISITLDFVHADGDLDLELVGPSGGLLGYSATIGSPETITLQAESSGTHYAVVYGWGFATNDYALTISTSAGSGCADDGYEPNDTAAGAALVSPGTIPGLQVCSGDDDYFAVSVPAGADLLVEAAFTNAAGDLDMALYDDSGLLWDTAYTISSNEVVVGENLPAGTYYVKVFGYAFAENAYTLTVDLLVLSCTDDFYEPNDSASGAAFLTPGTMTGFQICSDDADYYSFTVPAGSDVLAQIDFVHASGDLDFWLLGPDGTSIIDASTGTTNNEVVVGGMAQGGTYYLKVAGYAGAEAGYDLTLDVTAPPGGGCADDPNEPNDDSTDATRLFGLTNAVYDQALCSGDDDYFVVFMYTGETLDVSIDFLSSEGDLELYVLGPDGSSVLGASETSTDGENVMAAITTTGDHYIRVIGYMGAEAGYDLFADVVF